MERQLDVAVRVSRQAEAKQEMSRVWKHFEAGSKSASNASVRNIDAVVDRVKNISKAMQGATQDVEAFNKEFGDISRNARDLEFSHAFDGRNFRPNGQANVILTGQSNRGGGGGGLEKTLGRATRADTAIRSFDTLSNSISTAVNSIKSFDGSLVGAQRIAGDLANTTASVVSQMILLRQATAATSGQSALGGLPALLNPVGIALTAVGVAAWGAWKLFDNIKKSEKEEERTIEWGQQRGDWGEAIRKQSKSVENLLLLADALKDNVGRKGVSPEFIAEVAELLDKRLKKYGLAVDSNANVSIRTNPLDILNQLKDKESAVVSATERAADVIEREETLTRAAIERAGADSQKASQSLADMLKLPFSGPTPAAKGPGIFDPFGSVREQHDRLQSVGRAIAQGMLQGLRDGDKRTTHDATRVVDGVASVGW